MSETSLIFLSLIYFEIFQNKTSRQKDRRGEKRVRVEDKRKSRLLKFSDVVSVNLVTTLAVDHVVGWIVVTIGPQLRNIFYDILFCFIISKVNISCGGGGADRTTANNLPEHPAPCLSSLLVLVK